MPRLSLCDGDSWHNAANVMYVDQPVGTGLSFTTKANYADNDLEVCLVSRLRSGLWYRRSRVV